MKMGIRIITFTAIRAMIMCFFCHETQKMMLSHTKHLADFPQGKSHSNFSKKQFQIQITALNFFAFQRKLALEGNAILG